MRKLVVITYRWFIDPPTLLQLVKKAALNALKYGFDISYGCDCPLFFGGFFALLYCYRRYSIFAYSIMMCLCRLICGTAVLTIVIPFRLYLYPFFEDLITFVSNDFRKHLMRNKLFELLQSFLSKDEVYKLTDLFKLVIMMD